MVAKMLKFSKPWFLGGVYWWGRDCMVWTCLGLYKLFFLGYHYNAEKTNYSLRVIPTLTHYSDIFSDIPSGVYNILDIHIYSDILSRSC